MKHPLPAAFLTFLAFLSLLTAPARAQQSSTDTADDSVIAATIKVALLDNRNTSGTRINVDCYHGVGQLSGFARSEAEKTYATKVAAGVSGVKQVVNNVAVAPATSMGTRLDDSLVTGKVKAALMDAADVKSLQINVETHDGAVQLAGRERRQHKSEDVEQQHGHREQQRRVARHRDGGQERFGHA